MAMTPTHHWEQIRDLRRELSRLERINPTILLSDHVENMFDLEGPEPDTHADDAESVKWYGVLLASYESTIEAEGGTLR